MDLTFVTSGGPSDSAQAQRKSEPQQEEFLLRESAAGASSSSSRAGSSSTSFPAAAASSSFSGPKIMEVPVESESEVDVDALEARLHEYHSQLEDMKGELDEEEAKKGKEEEGETGK